MIRPFPGTGYSLCTLIYLKALAFLPMASGRLCFCLWITEYQFIPWFGKGKASWELAAGGIGIHLLERLAELWARMRALAGDNSWNEWGLLELQLATV